MSKKSEAVARQLDVITEELRVAFYSEASSIANIGHLLIEAKAQIKHGEWSLWLGHNFDLSDRTARKYMAVAEWASNRNPNSVLNLAPSVLYALAADKYGPKAAAKILKTAKSRRVDQGLAQMIVDETSAFGAEDETKLPKKEQQQIDREAADILDNPPRDLPPLPEPVPLETDKYLHEKLAALIIELKKLTTKSTDRFAACEIEPHDLENAADFLKLVAAKICSRRADNEEKPVKAEDLERTPVKAEDLERRRLTGEGR